MKGLVRMNELYAQADILRNGDLEGIAKLLQEQRTRAIDVVAPATSISGYHGDLVIEGTEAHIDEDGVTPTAGRYALTSSAEAQLAQTLDIPVPYARKLRTGALDLWDANVNGWLHGIETSSGRHAQSWDYPARGGDERNFLVRMLRGDGDGKGIVRAVLSDRYRVIDNLDVLLAVLDGVRESGIAIEIDGADLTERRMHVRIASPDVTAAAPALLAGYRSPFDNGFDRAGDIDRWRRIAANEGQGYEPGTEPIVWAGFVVANSETGHGSFSITPRLVVRVCKNGLTITTDAMRNVHLGGRLDEGVIRWSDDTQRKSLDLVKAQTRDAVTTFLDPAYLTSKIEQFEEQAGVPVKDAAKTVELVSKRLGFTEAEGRSILDHFIAGGQLTAGGVMQAVSSAAQTLADGDAAADMEAQAVPALALAAAAARA